MSKKKKITNGKDMSKFFIDEKFADAVQKHFPTMDILTQYPFCKKDANIYYEVLGSVVNLKELDKDSWWKLKYKKKNNWQLVAEIYLELSRAARYLMVENLDMQDGFHRQRLNVMCYIQLIYSGWSEFCKDYTEKEKDKYIKECMKLDKKTWNQPYDGTSNRTHYENMVKTYGIIKCHVKPLLDRYGKLNYNRKQLQAIHFMISLGEFENLC